ncbi:unnamed protein product, partial [Allacma fusca]
VKNLFSAPVISALWSILFGDKLKEDDPVLWEAFQGLNSVAHEASPSMFLPWFAKIAPKLSRFDHVIQGYSSMKRFLRKEIQRHNTHYVEDQPRDFVDAYTDEVQKTTDPNSSFHKRGNRWSCWEGTGSLIGGPGLYAIHRSRHQ